MPKQDIASVAAHNAQARTARAGLLDRLQAWWHGYESVDLPVPSEGQPQVRRHEPAPGETRRWTGARIVAMQRLFGSRFGAPGGTDWIEELLAPLELPEGASVADVQAGMGDIVRFLVERRGARVIGLEPDPALVAAAGEMLETDGLLDRATIRQATIHDDALGRASCDAIVAREALFEEPNKEAALRRLHAALRPGGQLLIADFVKHGNPGDSMDAEVWASYERTEPHLVPASEYADILREFGYEVQAVDDLSGGYSQFIRHALQGFASSLEGQRLDEAVRPWIAWSVEFWARRAQILEGGDIGYARIFARLPQDNAKTESK